MISQSPPQKLFQFFLNSIIQGLIIMLIGNLLQFD
jgi:hypothetical protein